MMNSTLLSASDQGAIPSSPLVAHLLLVLLFAGIIGGTTSFLVDILEDISKKSWIAFLKYNLLGLLSSLTVPLFLNTISSSLVEDAIDPKTDSWPVKLLIILGFCLVAAFSSRKFIDSITNAVFRGIEDAKSAAQDAKQAAQEAIEAAKRIEAAVSQGDEPDPQEPQPEERIREMQSTSPVPNKQYHIDGLSENENAVITAMINSRYNARAESGIRRDTGLAADELSQCIACLIEKNLVAERSTAEGFTKFYLTSAALGQVQAAPSL